MKQPSLIPSQPSPKGWTAYIDGGSRGNPGPAGFGVVLQDATGGTLETLSESIGTATNNVSEYRALLCALEHALEKGCSRLEIFCDSELVVRQMQGRYRVQSPDLKPLHARARQLAGRLEHFRIHHIPRNQNRDADRLANEAMDRADSGPPAGASPRDSTLSFAAVYEAGRLRPLPPAPQLEEGAEYEIRIRRRR